MTPGFPDDDAPDDPAAQLLAPPSAPPPAPLGAMAGLPPEDAPDPLRQALVQARTTTPDTAARVLNLRARTGLPADLIERNLDDVEKQAAQPDFNPEQFRAHSPLLAQWLQQQPQNAAVAHDDLTPLSAIEHVVSVGTNAVRALGAGLLQLQIGESGLLQTGAALVGASDVAARLGEKRRGYMQLAAATRGPQTGMSTLEKWGLQGPEAIGGMAPAMLAGGVLGSAEEGAGAEAIKAAVKAGTHATLAVMGLSVGGQEAGAALDAGKTPMEALTYGYGQGGVAVLTQMIPMHYFLGDIAAKTPLLQSVLHQVTQLPGQVIQTVVQKFTDWATLHPELPFSSYTHALPSDIAQTLVATVAMMGLTTAAGQVMAHAGKPASQQTVETLHAATEASKTRERSPSAFNDFVDAATKGGLAHVYAPADTFTDYFQKKGEDPAAVAAQLTGDPNAYKLAMASGGDLEIPTATYLSQVVGSGHEPFFAQELRLSPDGKNARETKDDIAAAATAEPTTPNPEDVAAHQAHEDAREAIYAEQLQKLTATGRFTPLEAETQATLYASVFDAAASRSGVDPLALFRDWSTGIASDGGRQVSDVGLRTDPLFPGEPGIPASVGGRNETRAQRADRQAGHTEAMTQHVVADALQTDPTADPAAIANEFQMRLAMHGESQDAAIESGQDPGAFLRAIVSAGGLHPSPRSGMFAGELAHLMESADPRVRGRRGPRGALTWKGVAGVFNPRTGKTLDGIREALVEAGQLDPDATINDVIDKLTTTLSTGSVAGTAIDPSRFPGTADLGHVGVALGTRWWDQGTPAPEDYAQKGPEGPKNDNGESAHFIGYMETGLPDEPAIALYQVGRDTFDAKQLAEKGIPVPETPPHGGPTEFKQGDESKQDDQAGRNLAPPEASAAYRASRFALSPNEQHSQDVLDELARLRGEDPDAPLVIPPEQRGGMPAEPPAPADHAAMRRGPIHWGPPEFHQSEDEFHLEDVPERTASTVAEAGEKLIESVVGRVLTNESTGQEATVSNKSVDKLTSGDAVARSSSPADHALAVANIDQLFERAILGSTKPDRNGDRNITGIHRFFAALRVPDGSNRLVRLTVKEFVKSGAPDRRIYTLEALRVEKLTGPASMLTDAPTSPESGGGEVSRPAGPLQSLVDAISAHNQARDRGDLQQHVRGSFNPVTRLIRLFKTANRSTFLHESAHLFLELYSDLASGEHTTPQLQADMGTLLKFFGFDGDLAAWRALTDEQRRDQHETFASAFEKYLGEGQAPTPELQPIFARFRSWILGVYKSLRNPQLGIELTPDVRQVMDRMVATDDAIRTAQADAHISALFTTAEDSGMTEQEFNGYRAKVQSASDEAQARLQARVMKDLTREEEQWWKDERTTMRAGVAADVQTQPAYRALAGMRGTLEGQVPTPLSRDSLVGQFGRGILERLPKQVYSADSGLPADTVAELYGFHSGEELLTAIITAPPIDQVIDARTDEQMERAHGDIFRDPTRLQDAARAAVADTHRDAVVRVELATLNKLREAAKPSVRAAVIDQQTDRREGAARLRSEMPDAATLTRLATQQIASMRLREIRPDRFTAAARRGSTEAVQAAAKGDFDAAITAKQTELVNLSLFREATAARAAVDHARETFAGMFGPDAAMGKTRDMDYVLAARAIAASVFWPEKRLEAATAALLVIKAHDPDLYDMLNEQIGSAQAGGTTLADMTFESFGVMRDAVDALWTLSREVSQFEIAGEKRQIDEVRHEVLDQVHRFSEPRAGVGVTRAATAWDKAKQGLLGFRARMRRVEQWTTAADNGPEGIVRSALYDPVNAGAVKYDGERSAIAQRYATEIVAPLDTSGLRRGDIHAPELNYTFNGANELLGALLHTGNGFEPGSNGYKLLVGGRGDNAPWGERTSEGGVDTSRWDQFVARMQQEGVLTKASYDYVQHVWDLNESIKGEAQKTFKGRFGRYFDERTTVGFDTPFGHYDGGYYPAIADPFLTPLAADRASTRDLMEGGGGGATMFPSVSRGFTKGRSNAYAKPLILDASQVLSHINAVLRFTYLSKPVHDVARLITHPGFSGELEKVDPAAISDMLKPFLDRAASQRMFLPMQGKAGRAMDTAARWIRTRGSAQIIALNATVLAEQFSHLPSVLVHPDIDATKMLAGVWRLSREPRVMAADIRESSPFMATRESAGLMEAHAAIDRILLDPNPAQRAGAWVQDHTTVLMRAIQSGMDLTTWQAAYDKVADEPDMTHERAVLRADSAVREALGSYRPQDRSAAEGGNQVAGLLNMFYGFFNTKLNMLGTAGLLASRLGLQRRYSRAFGIYALGFMVPAMLGKGIKVAMGSTPFQGPDEDDATAALRFWAESQEEMAARMLPFVGPAADIAVRRFFKTRPGDILNMPAITMVTNALSASGEAYQTLTDADNRTHAQNAKAITDFFTMLGMLSNLPMRPVGQAVNVIHDKVAAQ